LGSTKPFGEARDAEAAELEFLDRFEAFTQVEGGGGCVLRAGLNDCAFGCGLAFERGADEAGCNARGESAPDGRSSRWTSIVAALKRQLALRAATRSRNINRVRIASRIHPPNASASRIGTTSRISA
jgi:hypothetical protein